MKNMRLWLAGAGSLAIFRLIRLARVFRLFKLGRNSRLIGVFSATMTQSVRPMVTMIMFVVCGGAHTLTSHPLIHGRPCSFALPTRPAFRLKKSS